MKHPAKMTRRRFGTGAAAATALYAVPTIVPASALGRDGHVSANERIALGVVGIGPRCRYVLGGILPQSDVRCVAIADVQASRRQVGQKLVNEHYGNQDCRLYRDFRDVLARDDIDAVLIATGDRWHAPASILAAESGKDVYSEKPCGLTIGNCQQLADTIERTGRVFQAGTQRRSVANFQQAIRMAHSGTLGALKTLHATVYVPEMKSTWLPAEPTPDPDVVDWNMWLGPAPWRPYNSKYVAGGWRGYYDFDSGARLLDWGAHTVDLCQWANRADDTMPIQFDPHPRNVTARYANGVDLIIHFLETPFGKRPGWIQHLGTCPVRFVGEEGWVEVGDSGGLEAGPRSVRTAVPTLPKKESGLDVKAHARNFFDCMRSRESTAANAKVMRHSHIACHAAALAWMLQRSLKLDPKTETFVGDDEANRLRNRPPRNWA